MVVVFVDPLRETSASVPFSLAARDISGRGAVFFLGTWGSVHRLGEDCCSIGFIVQVFSCRVVYITNEGGIYLFCQGFLLKGWALYCYRNAERCSMDFEW